MLARFMLEEELRNGKLAALEMRNLISLKLYLATREPGRTNERTSDAENSSPSQSSVTWHRPSMAYAKAFEGCFNLFLVNPI